MSGLDEVSIKRVERFAERLEMRDPYDMHEFNRETRMLLLGLTRMRGKTKKDLFPNLR